MKRANLLGESMPLLISHKCLRVVALLLGIGMLYLMLGARPAIAGPMLAAPFSSDYTLTNLGIPAGVPGLLGGLTFKAGDLNTLLIGGNANGGSGVIDAITVTRDVNHHITGFSGSATQFATAPFIDGGLAYGPGGVLFFTGYPTNTLGEIKSGSTTPDKTVTLTGISSSVGTLAFVPAGFPSAGGFKIASYNGGGFYDATLTADGSGTYDVSNPTLKTTPGGGPEGIAYVPLGSKDFSNPSLLLSEYDLSKVGAYELDAGGNPVTRRDFITGLSGAEGALIDPLTGDFLFSTFGSGNGVFVVQGFSNPTAVPEPATLTLLGIGLAGLAGYGWRRRKQPVTV